MKLEQLTLYHFQIRIFSIRAFYFRVFSSELRELELFMLPHTGYFREIQASSPGLFHVKLNSNTKYNHFCKYLASGPPESNSIVINVLDILRDKLVFRSFCRKRVFLCSLVLTILPDPTATFFLDFFYFYF